MKTLIYLITGILIFQSCTMSNNTSIADNPILQEYNTLYGIPPFESITDEHYMPAFEYSIEKHNEEIKAIIENTEAPTFENTIIALENSGSLLSRTSYIFHNLEGANTNAKMQEISRDIAPIVSEHYDNIMLNDALFQKVKAVHDKIDEFEGEDKKLIQETFKNFTQRGALLSDADKEKLKEINKELSELNVKFGENVLKETNNYKLLINDSSELTGLPQSSIDAAAQLAKELDTNAQWVFTIQRPSIGPFLKYGDNREHRKSLYTWYTNKGNHNDEFDNKEIAKKMVVLRHQRAQLMGYKNHAEYILEDRLAKTPERVEDLLGKVWPSALKKAKQEVIDYQKVIDAEGGDFKLEAWDWDYYAEKLRKEKYDLDDEEIRPYFQLEKVIDGMFYVADRLYGLHFTKIDDVPKYHEDVVTYEVKDKDGNLLAIFMADFYARESKRGGAWMTEFRGQKYVDGKRIIPIISNVCNFSEPTGDKPTLLNFEEVTTVFHEFGHGLHGMLSDCRYESLSGTNVARDFVELPSQITENWALEPEVLKVYATHYKTGEVIPNELIEKIKAASKFNQGFALTEYLAASYLDMRLHTEISEEFDVLAYEKKTLDELGLIPEIASRYRTTYFNHIFNYSYSAGYYSYAWSEVLDADAYAAFTANGIFDEATAKAFKENVLMKGNTEDPLELYIRFRGQEPTVDAYLKRKGVL